MQITPEVLKVLNMLVKPLTMLVCAHRQLFYNSEFRWLVFNHNYELWVACYQAKYYTDANTGQNGSRFQIYLISLTTASLKNRKWEFLERKKKSL